MDNKVFIEVFNRLKEKITPYFDKLDGAHDFYHTQRVMNLGIIIAKKEGANLQILKLSALLHDIGRVEESRTKGKVCHAEVGAQMAEKMLDDLKIPYQTIEKVVHCIKTHRFRDSLVPQSIEARVLFDADKLDSIGASGLGRAFLFAGKIGATLHEKGIDIRKTVPYSKNDTAYREYYVKLSKVKDRMLTDTGKGLAAKRDQFMIEFFHQLNLEIEGIY